MRTRKLHPKELARRLKLPFGKKIDEWKKTREGKRQFKKK